MKIILSILLAGAALGFTGCATGERHYSRAGMGKMMKCSMCECKKPEADSKDPSKCKHCGHMMDDHKSASPSPEQDKGQEHHH